VAVTRIHTNVKRQANDILRELVGEHVHRDATIDFICECDDERCLESVELPAVRYDALRFESAWRPLADRHSRGAPDASSRRRRAWTPA
jgi:hypothetical protein